VRCLIETLVQEAFTSIRRSCERDSSFLILAGLAKSAEDSRRVRDFGGSGLVEAERGNGRLKLSFFITWKKESFESSIRFIHV